MNSQAAYPKPFSTGTNMERYPEDSYYLQCMKTILDAYPQHSPPVHPTKLTDKLYIGNQDNADDVTLLSSLEVTHVLNCAGTRNFDLTRSPYPPSSGIKGFLMIPAQDYDEFNIMQYFDDAIGFLDGAILNGGKAFVHCSIGVNRSGAIVAAYLMISQRKRLMDVIVELKAKRLLILCNMGFRKQLVQFARVNGLLDRVDMSGPKPRQFRLEAADAEQGKDAKVEEDWVNKTSQNGIKETNGENATENPRKDEVDDKESPTASALSERRVEQNQTEETKPAEPQTKKYIYRTRNYASETVKPKYFSSDNKVSSRHFKDVDSNILVKLLNESYDKYKQSSKLKDYETPSKIKSSLPTTLTLISHQQNFAKKSAEKELAREVEDFLTSDKVKTRSDVDSLLGGIISKKDERLIWGKGNLEDDPEYQLFRDNLENPKLLSHSLPSQAPLSAEVSNKTRPLEHLLKKYQETTSSEILKDLQDLAKVPSKRLGIALERPSHKSQEYWALDEKVSDYLQKSKHLVLPSTTRNSPLEVSKRISAFSPTNIKPISFYKLQVLNEKKTKDPELQQAANEYLSVADGHVNITGPSGSVTLLRRPLSSYSGRYLDRHI